MILNRPFTYLAAWLLPVASLWAQTPSELGVLKVVPAEAWVVLTVRSLTDVDQKIGTLSQQLTLPVPPSPLAMAKGYLGLLNGLDDAREAALAFMPSETIDSPGDSMVIFFPCKDYKQLLTFLEPAEVAPGVSKIRLGTDEAFMAEKNGFAIAAPTQPLLERAVRSERSIYEQLTDDDRRTFATDDITVWANVAAFSASQAFPRFRELLAGVQGDPERVQDLKSVAISLQMAAEGLHFKLFVEAKPGTEAARLAEAVKPSDGSLLGGLPADRLILAYGTTASAQSASLVAENVKRMLNRIPAERRQRVLSDTKLESLRQFVDNTLAQLRGMNLAVNSAASPDHGRMTMTAVFHTEGQAARIREQLADFVNRMKADEGTGTSDPSATQNPGRGGLMNNLEYVSQADTVAGESIDELRWSPPTSDDTDRPLIDGLASMFGKGGFVARITTVGDSDLAVVLGGNPSDLESTLAAVKAHQNSVGEHNLITQAASHLPAGKSSEGYVKVDELIRTLAAVGEDMNEPWPIDDVPEVNAVAAFSTTPHGQSGSRTDLFLPMEILINVKDLAMQRRAARTPPVN